MVLEAEETELNMTEVNHTLVIQGDLDLYEAPHFRTIAEEYISHTDSPRFDMTDVPFLDSAGLATLLYLSRQADAHHKTLHVQIAGGPRRVLHLTGIDRLIVVED